MLITLIDTALLGFVFFFFLVLVCFFLFSYYYVITSFAVFLFHLFLLHTLIGGNKPQSYTRVKLIIQEFTRGWKTNRITRSEEEHLQEIRIYYYPFGTYCVQVDCVYIHMKEKQKVLGSLTFPWYSLLLSYHY